VNPSQFEAELLRPANGEAWCFLVLPKAVSDTLPRRGRTTVEGTINDAPFTVTLEPDGKLSHWLKVDGVLLRGAKAQAGDVVTVVLAPVAQEPEPQLPADFQETLAATPAAQATWDATTILARVDWIHWIVSAKQTKTRAKRIAVACDKLASGKKRVCCFDPSGHYDKSLSAPQAVDKSTQ
jgi:hypothetical protein